MEHIQQQPEQHEVLRKRSDLLNDSDEKELSTDNSYVSLERLNSTPFYAGSETPALSISQDLPLASPSIVSTSASQETLKCLYCDASHPKEQLAQHLENCEMRKINCEACGEMVMIDIFDFHLETCANRVDPYAIYQNFANYQEFTYAHGEFVVEGENVQAQQPAESWNQVEGEEDNEEQDPQDDEEYDDFDPDTLTYEQLIALDSTIVKKGMSAQEIAKMPVETHCEETDSGHSCSVCISEFESGESLRKLPCGHKFHKECIDTWMESNITCPICKKFLR